MRLIDADAMVVALRVAAKHMHTSDSEWLKGYVDGLDAASNAVEEAPTIEAEPVRHGRWIKDQQSKFEHRYNCSGCNYRLIGEPTNYCPNCGTNMMDGDKDGR